MTGAFYFKLHYFLTIQHNFCYCYADVLSAALIFVLGQLFFIPHRSCCSAIGQVMVSDWILRNFVSKWRNKSSEVRLPGHMTKFTS